MSRLPTFFSFFLRVLLPQVIHTSSSRNISLASLTRSQSMSLLRNLWVYRLLIWSGELWEAGLLRRPFKGHSQLWDRADLDTSFLTLNKVYPNFRSVLLDFQSFTEKPVFECPFIHPMILFLLYVVKISKYRLSVLCKISYEMVSNAHVHQLIVFL